MLTSLHVFFDCCSLINIGVCSPCLHWQLLFIVCPSWTFYWCFWPFSSDNDTCCWLHCGILASRFAIYFWCSHSCWLQSCDSAAVVSLRYLSIRLIPSMSACLLLGKFCHVCPHTSLVSLFLAVSTLFFEIFGCSALTLACHLTLFLSLVSVLSALHNSCVSWI